MNITIEERFAKDTAGHQMIVKRDDGLYRHLRFMHHHLCNDGEMRPGTSFYWFDLITWPGTLTIHGDCGTFVFSRITDMFEFFRSRYGINPQYWAEKLQAPDPRNAKTYSEDVFRQHVVEDVSEAIRYGDAPRGIGKAVRDEIFGPYAKWSTEYEEGAREALRDFGYKGFRFGDAAWEWDLTDFDWQYLWCCHAIQYGIALYDASKAVAA